VTVAVGSGPEGASSRLRPNNSSRHDGSNQIPRGLTGELTSGFVNGEFESRAANMTTPADGVNGRPQWGQAHRPGPYPRTGERGAVAGPTDADWLRLRPGTLTIHGPLKGDIRFGPSTGLCTEILIRFRITGSGGSLRGRSGVRTGSRGFSTTLHLASATPMFGGSARGFGALVAKPGGRPSSRWNCGTCFRRPRSAPSRRGTAGGLDAR